MTAVLRFLRHPAYVRLSEFSDGTLAADAAQRISNHLERCERCRREVGMIRDADEALRAVPVPSLPEGLFERILERRADNIRTILPADPVHTPRAAISAGRSWIPAGAFATVILLVGAVVLFTPGREATAGASSFEIASNGGVDGRTAAVYRPGSLLRDEPTVRVRARVWSLDATVPPFTVEIGALDRADAGFEGLVEVPPGTGYMLIALEDRNGVTIDANAGEFWGSGSGAGTAAELHAQVRAFHELSLGGLLSASQVRLAAVSATNAHAESPELWRERARYELRVVTASDARDSLLTLHRRRVDGFLSSASLNDSDQIVSLLEYAELVRHEAAAELLSGRLAAVAPSHRLVIEERSEKRLAASQGGSLATLLAGFDDDFVAVDGFSQYIAGLGYVTSLDSTDPETRLRWARRLYAGDPDSRDGIAIGLSRDPDLRDYGIEWIRDRLAFYESAPDSMRALHQSTRDFSSAVESIVARLHAALGLALAEEGDRTPAVSALEESIRLRWNSAVAARLRELVAERSAVRARELAALIQADPLKPTEISLPAVDFTPAELRKAARDLEEWLQQDTRRGRVPDAVLRSRVGERVAIDDGGVSLIALWQAPPPLEAEEATDLANAARQLTSAGVRVLIASPERWLDETVEVADMVGARPVVDENGSATEGFGGWDLWEYVVVHDGLYSVHYELEDATRLALLRSEISSQGR